MLDESYSPGHIHPLFESKTSKEVKANLKVDRLTLLLPLHPNDHEIALNHLISLKLHAGAEGILPAGWSAKKGSMVAFSVMIPTSTSPLIWSKTPGALVQLKPAPGGKRLLRIEIFPLGLTPEGFTYLYDELLCGHLSMHPGEIAKARVSRLDLALDLHGVRLQDWAWAMPSRSVVRHYVSKGVVRTLYLGSPKHGAPCIYDKASQQKMSGGEAWTRVELRPKPNVPLAALPLLKNPFAAMRVYDVRSAFGVVNPGQVCRELALSHAQLKGITNLLGHVPDTKGHSMAKSARQRLREALDGSAPSWWTPQTFWQGWPDALAMAMPPLFEKTPLIG